MNARKNALKTPEQEFLKFALTGSNNFRIGRGYHCQNVLVKVRVDH